MRAGYGWLAAALGVAAAAWLVGIPRSDSSEPADEAAVLDQTIAALEPRYGNDPYNTVIGGHLAGLHMRRFALAANLEDVERAERIARDVLPFTADTAAAHARLSMILLARHEFGDALGAAQAAVRADSSDAAAQAALFEAALAIGRHDVAEKALGALPQGTVDRRLRQARWLADHGDLGRARHHLGRSCEDLERSPVPRQTVAWCLTLMADLEHQRMGPDSARAWLGRALEVRPGYRGALEGLADLAYAERRWREADRLYRRIATDAHPDLFLRLAETRYEIGDGEDARRWEDRFLTVAEAPGNEALYGRPLAYHYAARTGTLDLALPIARRELERRPTAESYELLAWIHLQRDALEDALDASNRARELVPGDASSDYVRARILARMGRATEAARLDKNALADSTLLEPHVLAELRSSRTGHRRP